jgi:hypothetical protein
MRAHNTDTGYSRVSTIRTLVDYHVYVIISQLILSPNDYYDVPSDGKTRRVSVWWETTRQSAVVDCRRHHHNQQPTWYETNVMSHNNILLYDTKHTTQHNTTINLRSLQAVRSAR